MRSGARSSGGVHAQAFHRGTTHPVRFAGAAGSAVVPGGHVAVATPLVALPQVGTQKAGTKGAVCDLLQGGGREQVHSQAFQMCRLSFAAAPI